MRVLVIGPGFVGLPLALELKRQGHEVVALRRSAAAVPDLDAAGIPVLHADIRSPHARGKLPGPFDWVVNCAATGGGTPEDYRDTYLEGTRNLLRWLADDPPRRYIYTSSTSVYGQNDGSVVDESSPADPPSETGRILVETEKALLQAAAHDHFPATVLRLSGIYGEGRGYWLRQFLSGEARIDGSGDRWLNMVHRGDVVGAVLAALSCGSAGQVINVSDNEPVTQLAVFQWLSELLGRPLPPRTTEAREPSRRGVTNKRISNQRLRRELGYELKFPTFREGYAAELRRQGLLG